MDAFLHLLHNSCKDLHNSYILGSVSTGCVNDVNFTHKNVTLICAVGRNFAL